MTRDVLESSAVSAFCGSLATMLAAGIQHDEALRMLADEQGESRFGDVCADMYRSVAEGRSLSEAMAAGGGFPVHACDLVAAGERSGRIEQVLRNLETYYDEEDRMFEKLRSSVSYPAALLVIMTVILAFTVSAILPVFRDVYANMTGGLAAGAAVGVRLSSVIGWVALAVCALAALAAVSLSLSCRTAAGRQRVVRLFERLPVTRGAFYQLALSRFTAALATHVSSGVTEEEAVQRSSVAVEHDALAEQLAAVHGSMVDLDDPRSLSQALGETRVFEPLYARMLNVGMRSGAADETLSQLSTTFFEDAVLQIDRVLDRVEPLLAAFLTVAVGATLISAMLPLVGIMASLG